MCTKIKFNVPIDDDGYVSLQCPFCREAFKITPSDYEAEENFQLYCPYCGLVSEEGFHTDEIKEHAFDLAQNHCNELINQFMKNMERQFKGNGFASFEAGKPLPIKKPKTLIEPTDMQEVSLKCCKKKIKVQYRVNGAYCPFCGVK